MKLNTTNLFVYGSLREPRIFQGVCGLSFTFKARELNEITLYAAPAFLSGYRKVSPDNVYFYAVEDSSSRMEGFVIYDVPPEAMKEIDKYEGKRYKREKVKVNTASGFVSAEAYLVSKESMREHFGDRFHVNLIHELWLRKRIEEFFEKNTRPGEKSIDADLERRARRELLATTERDLVISHYRSDAVSDFYLEHELDRPLPSIKPLFNEPEAQKFMPDYISLVVRQVLLNELDDKLQYRYRFELEHMDISDRYYKRSVSILAALQILNTNKGTMDIIVQRCLETMPPGENDLIDYVKYAINAADSIFDERVARSVLDRIKGSFQPGLIPLGAEIELSNLGYMAVMQKGMKEEACDIVYDSFNYFNDFYLNVLMWKLGGYIDDHSGDMTKDRKTGFLELAPGRLNVEGELSRPATNDPWVLNQLIREIVSFYNIRPHSLHLSFQLRKNQIGKQKMLPFNFIKCLLVLGGGLELSNSGKKMSVSRMKHDEITANDYGEELVFARTSKRKWHMAEDHIAEKTPRQAVTHIQQYKFIRLDERATYEPIIVCLKGLQLECNPAEYLNIEQLRNNPKLRKQYAELKEWSDHPTEISDDTIKRFTRAIYNGLMKEAHNRPAHKPHYIDWAVSVIDAQLRMFNKKIRNIRTER